MTAYYVSNVANNGYVIGNDSNNGLSPATAFLTINHAVNSAASTGDTVIVNPSGTAYAESTAAATLILNTAVNLMGDPAYVVRGATVPIIQAGGSYSQVLSTGGHASTVTDIGIDTQSAARTGITCPSNSSAITLTGIVFYNLAAANVGISDTNDASTINIDKAFLLSANGNSSTCILNTTNNSSVTMNFTGLTQNCGSIGGTLGTLTFGSSADGTKTNLSSNLTGGSFINISSTTTGFNLYLNGVQFGAINSTANVIVVGNTMGTLSVIGCSTTANLASGKSFMRITGSPTTLIIENNNVQGSSTGTVSPFISTAATLVCTAATVTGNIFNACLVDLRGKVTTGICSGNQWTGTIPSLGSCFLGDGYQSNWTFHDNNIAMKGIGAQDVVRCSPSGGFQAYNNNIITDSQPSGHQLYAGLDGYGLVASNTGGTLSDQNLGDLSTNTYVASPFVWTAAYNIDVFLGALAVELKNIGSPTGTVDCYLYSNNAGVPGTQLVHSNWTLSASSYQTSYNWQQFWSDARYQATAGSTYWIVLKYTGSNDATNYLTVQKNALATKIQTSTDGVTWVAGTGEFVFQTFCSNLSCVQPSIHDNIVNTYNNQSLEVQFTHGLVLCNTDGGLIYRNQAYGLGISYMLKLVDGSVHPAVIYDNLAYSYIANTIQMTLIKGSKNAYMLNNTIISGGQQSLWGCYADSPTGGTFWNATPAVNPVIENNIFVNNGNPAFFAVLGSFNNGLTVVNATINYNVDYNTGSYATAFAEVNLGTSATFTNYATFAAYQSATSMDTNTVTTSPLLANQTNPSTPAGFIPAANSPAVGIGVNESSFYTTDYFKNPFYAVYDAGAVSIGYANLNLESKGINISPFWGQTF